MSTSPDLCIIGAGALGTDLALYARRLGIDVCLVDRGQPEPGDAARYALRTASLVESARRANDMRRAPTLGVGASEFKLSIKQVGERANAVAEHGARETSPAILAAKGVTMMEGAVTFVDPRTLRVGDAVLKPARIILALGGEPVVPDLPGLKDIAYFTLDSILDNQRKLTHLVIVGADSAALEQAQLQRRFGAEVTVVPQGPLLPEFDAEGTGLLVDALIEEGIRIHRGARIAAINARSQGIGIEILKEDGSSEALDASHVLVSAGRRVDFEPLDIGKAKLKPMGDGQTLARDPSGTTSSRGIRIAGVAAGQDGWAEARSHGRHLVDAFFGKGGRRGAARTPRIVATEPALAQIGPIDGALRAQPGHTILRGNFAENHRAAAMGQGRGLVKLILDGQGQILGATVVGPMAPELAGVLALAMDRRLDLAALADLPLPHPSLFSVLTGLAENYIASRPVSTLSRHGQTIRRFWRR